MAKSARGRRGLSSHLRSTPYPLPSHGQAIQEDGKSKETSKVIKEDWEDATCSVCMEYPHNAVLLLCSSHDKGCRPYMCGTSHRYSNCLDQFKKAYMKAENQSGSLSSSNWPPAEAPSSITELLCPLCRGQVKGWTVVEPARVYLNAKKRSCTQDNCSFAGTYKELRKHVRAVHPTAKPHQVDPLLEQKWRRLERERDREDVISTIRSSMPGAIVLGDYVIENSGGYDSDGEEDVLGAEDNHRGGASRSDENWFNFLFLLQAFGNSGNASFASRLRRSRRSYRALDGEGAGIGGAPFTPSSSIDISLLSQASEGDIIDEDDDMVISQGRGIGTQRTARPRRRRRSRSHSEMGFT